MITAKKTDTEWLRQKAEEQLANDPQISDLNVLEMDIMKLQHELQVYLIELDMQYNELSLQHAGNEERETNLLNANKELAEQNNEKVKRVEELIKLTDKLEHLNSFLLDREVKMIELKKEINDLLELGGFKKKYII